MRRECSHKVLHKLRATISRTNHEKSSSSDQPQTTNHNSTTPLTERLSMSTNRRVPTLSLFRILGLLVAVAIFVASLPSRANAQTFILYDPAISSSPQTVTSATLADLLVPGAYIQVDGAEFSSFAFSAAAFGGAPTPMAADILITAPTSPIPELFFQGGPFEALNNQLVDASLKFDVTALSNDAKLTTAELKYTGGTSGTGTTSIIEDIDDMNNDLIGQGSYIIQQGYAGSSNSGSIDFAAQQEIQVSKDIMLYGSATGDSASISDFSQAFDAPTVPEPSSIAMAVLGGGALGWYGWRRRKKSLGATATQTGSEHTQRPEFVATTVGFGRLQGATA